MRRIGEDVAAGRIHPLPYMTYPVDALAGAFQAMAAREHTGKLVIVFPDEGTVRAVVPAAQVRVAREDGAYVITGGLGGLGLPLARHLAEGGAGRIVLGDRVRPDDEAERTIAALRDAGADVAFVLGDLSDPATAPRLIAAATVTGLPLRGVAHAADAAEEAAVGRIDDDLLDRVWAPKAFGAWHLFGACAGRPLDWWLSFSSAAALVGGQGQAAHAGADGWLDAFTVHARARGVPVQSINGVPPDPADRIALIDLVLRHDRAQTGHLPHDAFPGERARSIPFFAGPARRGRPGDTLRTPSGELL
jgi:NAD(P)-dependent dehydrogenase (short-subunit alcohol dehydrogenase family)